MFNPTDISKSFFDGRLADVYFVGESGFTPGTITLNGSGGFTGTFAGSVSGTPNGDLTITTAEDGNIPAKVNASKNIIAVARGDADESEYTLLVKKPDTLATADFEGAWRVSSIQIPTSLTENFYNIVTNQSRQADSADVARENEILVDIFHKSQPDLSRLQFMIDSSGNITGSETGKIVANGDRSATVTIDGTSFPIHPNADKTFMMAAIDDADSHEFVIAVKTREAFPATFEEQVDLTPIVINGKLILNWNSASNLMLEESSTLGGWGEVTEAAGSDSFTADTSAGGSRFYRVAERPAGQ